MSALILTASRVEKKRTEAGRSVHAEEVAELRALLEEVQRCSFGIFKTSRLAAKLLNWLLGIQRIAYIWWVMYKHRL